MPALPTPGGSTGTWGDELNEFLQVVHNADGTVDAASIDVADSGANFTATDVEAALAELQTNIENNNPWDRIIDEAGDSLANWTQAVGTWTTDGTKYLLTGAAATWNRLVHAEHVPGLCVASVEFLIDSTATSYTDQRLVCLFNSGGSSLGFAGGIKWANNSPASNAQGYAEQFAIAGFSGPTIAGGLAQDTWHTMKVMLSGDVVTVWVNGVLIFARYITTTAGTDISLFTLASSQAKINIRNITVDQLTLPV